MSTSCAGSASFQPRLTHSPRLTDAGHAYNAVARQLGLHWRTVRKYATATSSQECVRRPRPRVPSPLDPYLQYLQQCWNEGEHKATLLHQELKAKGFVGHYQLAFRS